MARTRCVGLWICVVAVLSVAHSRVLAAPEKLIPPDMVLHGHSDGIMSLCFSPDGKYLASASHDNTVRTWDAQSGKLIHTYDGHTEAAYGVSFSPDGKWLASCSNDKTIKVWDLATHDQIAELDGHSYLVRNLSFRPDGTLLSIGGDGLRLWDVKNEKLLWRSNTTDEAVPVHCMTVSADGRYCAYSLQTGYTVVWDVTARKQVTEMGAAKYLPTAIGLSPDGRTLFALGLSGTDAQRSQLFERLDLQTNQRSELLDETKMVAGFAITTDGRYAATVSAQYSPIVVWETGNWNKLQSLDFTVAKSDHARAIAFTPDGRHLAAASTGSARDGNWKKSTENVIAIYTNPAFLEKKPPKLGEPAGSISWNVIPTVVQRRAGSPVPLNNYRHYEGAYSVKAFAANTEFDLIGAPQSVLLHRVKGVLQEVRSGPDARFSDVAWDEKNIWVCDLNTGIEVIDPTSLQEIARLTVRDGLPPALKWLRILTVGPGKAVAVGGDNSDVGWCALVEQTGDKMQLHMLVQPGKLPPDWPIDSFTPWFLNSPPGAAGGHKIAYAVCSGGRNIEPILKIDVEARSVSTYNCPGELATRRVNAVQTARMTAGFWLSDAVYLSTNFGTATRMKAGPQFFDLVNNKEIYRGYEGSPDGPVLEKDGQYFMVGKTWVRLDPQNMKAQELGPGLRIDEELAGRDVLYLKSALLGLAALDAGSGSFYQFSVDPAHPATVHATRDLAGAPIPPDGVLSAESQKTEVFCGVCGLVFENGTVAEVHSSAKWQLPLADRDKQIAVIRGRLNNRNSLGINITSAQYQNIRKVEGAQPKLALDVPKLLRLFDAYQATAAKEARQAAADAIFAEVKAYGQSRYESQEKLTAGIRAAVNPHEWEQLAAN